MAISMIEVETRSAIAIFVFVIVSAAIVTIYKKTAKLAVREEQIILALIDSQRAMEKRIYEVIEELLNQFKIGIDKEK
jgi:hypothetical protein